MPAPRPPPGCDGHWLTTYIEDLDSSLDLPVLDCELSMAQVYDKVDL